MRYGFIAYKLCAARVNTHVTKVQQQQKHYNTSSQRFLSLLSISNSLYFSPSFSLSLSFTASHQHYYMYRIYLPNDFVCSYERNCFSERLLCAPFVDPPLHCIKFASWNQRFSPSTLCCSHAHNFRLNQNGKSPTGVVELKSQPLRNPVPALLASLSDCQYFSAENNSIFQANPTYFAWFRVTVAYYARHVLFSTPCALF